MAVGTVRLMKPSERRGIGRRLGLSVNAKLVTRPAHERRCATGDDSLGVGLLQLVFRAGRADVADVGFPGRVDFPWRGGRSYRVGRLR
jgi:hypothetical protein